nr:MAG TPA: hypothetical protein [Caudoviricetes sp.]
MRYLIIDQLVSCWFAKLISSAQALKTLAS